MQVQFNPAQCTHCLVCAEICPTSALQVTALRLIGVDPPACVLCGACIVACPEEALTF
jgi:ferredoxin